MRTDRHRLAAVRLVKLRGQRDRVGHRLDLKRRELAHLITTPGSRGWSEPQAIELSSQIRPLVREFGRIGDEIRALLSERRRQCQ